MGAAIEICTGRVHVFRQGAGNSGRGFYATDPAVVVPNGSRCLVMGVPIEQREIVQPVVTLDDQRILYAFGSAWSQATVLLKILLGESSGDGRALGAVQTWYDTNRLVKRLDSPVGLSIATKAHDVFLVGLNIGQADGQYNTQDVSLSFMLSKD